VVGAAGGERERAMDGAVFTNVHELFMNCLFVCSWLWLAALVCS
jgi:hypothetical protein